SRYYGAKEYEKIRKVTWMTFFICGIGAFAIGSFILLNGPFLLGLLTREEEIISLGMYRLSCVTFFLFLNGLLDVIVNSIRGMGLIYLPTLITLFGVCGFRLVYLYTYFALHHTPVALYSCFPLSWMLALLIQLPIWFIRYRRIRQERGN
ncbi:MAG: hypothetical protein IKI79_04660, partial [Erysipelotrichaceae bacterium]|nr:hypothetical protein [Erysipelotrichaceae bacterium]